MAVQQLNAGNFDEVINGTTLPVVVDFYADWCQPCKRIAPLLEEMATEYDGRALICKVNVDEDQALAARFNIMSIPYVASFKDGKLHKQVVGAVPKSELTGLID